MAVSVTAASGLRMESQGTSVDAGGVGHLDLNGNTQAPHQCPLLGGDPSNCGALGPPALPYFGGDSQPGSSVKGESVLGGFILLERPGLSVPPSSIAQG